MYSCLFLRWSDRQSWNRSVWKVRVFCKYFLFPLKITRLVLSSASFQLISWICRLLCGKASRNEPSILQSVKRLKIWEIVAFASEAEGIIIFSYHLNLSSDRNRNLVCLYPVDYQLSIALFSLGGGALWCATMEQDLDK